MNIIVCVKQVPDPDTLAGQFAIDEAAKRLVPLPEVASVMNGYDANAVEAALRLKEQMGGNVTVISVGEPDAREVLKRGIALGADQAVLLSDPCFADLDSAGTAAVLVAAIRRLGGADLILCGRQASDTDAGQVHLAIASLLGLPGLTPVRLVSPKADGEVRVERVLEDGYQVVDVHLPAVLGISSEQYEPRYPPLRGKLAAGKAQIPVWGMLDLEISAEQLLRRLRLVHLYAEQREASVELIEADSPAGSGEKLALKLREAKLI